MPKETVLDPQGVAVRDAIQHHDLREVKSVRIGKFLELDIEEAGGNIEERLHTICRDLLSNPVVEDYRLEIIE